MHKAREILIERSRAVTNWSKPWTPVLTRDTASQFRFVFSPRRPFPRYCFVFQRYFEISRHIFLFISPFPFLWSWGVGKRGSPDLRWFEGDKTANRQKFVLISTSRPALAVRFIHAEVAPMPSSPRLRFACFVGSTPETRRQLHQASPHFSSLHRGWGYVGAEEADAPTSQPSFWLHRGRVRRRKRRQATPSLPRLRFICIEPKYTGEEKGSHAKLVVRRRFACT